MARPSPGGNASGARSWMATLLCAAALFSGPDVGQMEAQQGLPSLLRPSLASALSEEQDVVNDVWRVVNAAYVDPTFNGQDWKAIRLKVLKQVQDRRGKEEAYSAVKGMLKGLGDPYTRFLTPQEYDAVTGLARGGVAGVGLELASSPASSGNPLSVIVAGVVGGSPAEKAGVLTGDVLSAVDGEEASGTDLDTVAGMLRGDPGSGVRLDVRRGGKTFAFPLTRAQFKYQGVRSEVRSNGGQKVGIVSIKVFSKDTFEDVRAAVDRTIDEGAQSIVLDLRHNPGGFFPGGIDVARLFLSSDETIVSVVDRNGISDTYGAIATGKFSKIPLVLVVDEKTASASEILSAALKDNGRAKLAGHKTFGKAKVQTLNQIFDGSGVAVTISLYKTPSGIDINGKGIPVDYPSECPYPGDALACVPPNALR
ncbi:carboxyl-terminal protease [Ectocarpus siliculosus]|uniref:Carboxyl-terminal protease n=1 Tax=Ectocarpus siliculosus TaxID=2880 RepID=D7G2Y9_ECTSI|nr:carboxyl-terminal protease [Ectocarpus siliculosus]|eukprot:CBJ48846.1 carboxyl-terminal protease [Ectocarpus siliculosus]